MEPRQASPLTLAILLSLAAAVSLGITRFAYGLLLPPMRADLGWTYTLAGSMNTTNAFGYFVGALCTPALMRLGCGTRAAGGCFSCQFFHGRQRFFHRQHDAGAGRAQARQARWCSLAVVCSPRAVRASSAGQTQQSGLVLGIYYGGSGFGILLFGAGGTSAARRCGTGRTLAWLRPWAWAW